MKKVMVFGTFDIFHLGHKNFLNQAKQKGDYLIVVIARDQTVEKIKKAKPQNNENDRLKIVKNSGLADKVILGNLKNKYQVIKKYQPDVICLGYDQKYFIDNLVEKLQQYRLSGIKIIKLKSFKPNIYKTSKLSCL
ncbi:FAD synthase [Patescibacteria group bacterium]|nr:FAD synthase [Patescibacteria group bacterium]MBU0879889.1 FAD synthase [Patescibacteria group bacterium]MBU0880432.1 FAD synthase [Patescibacteria group bacterium]MBU1063145.1 FAD synthase [Patescibacteria group bacterium]MBU1783105.1 FAD synthase [Patescibacteria group bacterium]